MLIDGFGFGGGWFHGFAAAGCAVSGFAAVGLAAESFKALGLAAVGSAVVRFKQHWVHSTEAAETTSVLQDHRMQCCKAKCGEAIVLSRPYLADVKINQTEK